MRTALALACLLGVVCAASADYTLGAGGYYWNNGRPYTRSQAYQNGYYANGCYHPGYYYYQYSEVYNYSAPAVTHKDADWRTKLLELAAQRDKFEGSIRKDAAEQKYFLEAVEALGLKNNFRWESYGISPYGQNYKAYGGVDYGRLQLGEYGANANTLYGYSYNSIAQLYGDTDLATLYQQAARLADQSQKHGSQATTEFQALVEKEGHNRTKVAEILAKGQAVQEFLRAIEGSGVSVSKQELKFRIEKDEHGKPQVLKQENPDAFKAWRAHAEQKCASCHNNTTKKGGFDVTSYPTMNLDQQISVIERLVTKDQTKVMPRNKDGAPGHRLTPEELKLWLLN